MHNLVYEEGELNEEVERYINYQIILERETTKEMPVFQHPHTPETDTAESEDYLST